MRGNAVFVNHAFSPCRHGGRIETELRLVERIVKWSAEGRSGVVEVAVKVHGEDSFDAMGEDEYGLSMFVFDENVGTSCFISDLTYETVQIGHDDFNK